VAPPPRKRLGEILVEAGIIDGTQLVSALAHQRRWGGRIGQALIDLKMATEEQIVATLASKLGFKRFPVDALESSPSVDAAMKLVPHEFAERNQLLPYATDGSSLWVAMADPTNIGVIDELAFRTGRNVRLTIAGDREVANAIRRLYVGDRRGLKAIALDDLEEDAADLAGQLVHHGYPQGPPGPEGRLAAAARGIRTPAPSMTPVPRDPPARSVEIFPEEDGGGDLGPRAAVILDGLDRVATAEGSSPELARLARFSSALVRLLIKKQLITGDELATAIVQAGRPNPRR
jgi:hypothetical protein